MGDQAGSVPTREEERGVSRSPWRGQTGWGPLEWGIDQAGGGRQSGVVCVGFSALDVCRLWGGVSQTRIAVLERVSWK